jgi:dimethylargininase
MAAGLRTFVAREPIDGECALAQHAAYCQVLRRLGADVGMLDVNRELPDCAFIEDTAIVLDEVAVLAAMGEEARRAEPTGIEPELRKHREVIRVEPPATFEGGDVLRVGRTLLVGQSRRTNAEGVRALEGIGRRLGYEVRAVPVRHCLHLKTACTALDERRLLVNAAWLDVGDLRGFERIAVAETEPWAANVLCVGASVLVDARHERTAELLGSLGFVIEPVDLSEFAKAEGGVTCLSLLVDPGMQ